MTKVTYLFAAAIEVSALCGGGAAMAAPTTASIDFRIQDVLVLTNIGTTVTPEGVSTGTADALDAAFGISGGPGTGANTTDAHGLIQTFAGLSEISTTVGTGTSGSARYNVSASGAANAVTDVSTPAIKTISFATQTLLAFGGSYQTSLPTVTDAGSTSDSLAKIGTPFQSENATSSSANGVPNQGSAAAQSSVTVLSFLLDDTKVKAINGGSSIFSLGVYLDVVAALLNLTSDALGSFADGNFDLTIEITTFTSTTTQAGKSVTGGIVISAAGQVADGIDDSITGETTAASTLGVGVNALTVDLLDGPIVTKSIDSSVAKRVEVKIAMSARDSVLAGNVVPEPGSIALLCLGGLCVGVPALRRRRSTVAAA